MSEKQNGNSKIMQYIKRFLKMIGGLAALFVSGGLLLMAWFYATCPVYHFDEPQPFSGENFYNPYENAAPDCWKKAIFHLHTQSWGGITDGKGNNQKMVDSVYGSLGYNLITISNYMSFQPDENECVISAYEHGYNIRKTHQLCLNCHKPVLFRDYFFPHGLHQKQHIIHQLKDRCEVVALNHPGIRDGYRFEELRYLTGYDLLEVLNGARNSAEEWDAALTAGHPVWLIANDDSHHAANAEDVHLDATFLNTPSTCRTDVLSALTAGNAFGVRLPRNRTTLQEKQNDAAHISLPQRITVQNDTLFVLWQQPMTTIRFVGSEGKTLKTVSNSDSACYAIQPSDKYVRTELVDNQEFKYYLNPIIRCSETMPQPQNLAQIDTTKTIAKRIAMAAITIVLLILFVKIYKKIKR